MKAITSRIERSLIPVLVTVALLVVAGIFSLSYRVERAQSSSGVAVTGWAWSENTGWVSLNCLNDSSCASNSFGLTLNNNTNLLSGYAWSENIGWVKFGGLSSFPSGSGTSPSDAALQSNGTITGWARACAGTSTGDCSTMASRSDGWDGWIALSGTASDGSPYGVTTNLNPSYLANYAWGSDNVGWVSFNLSLPSCTATGYVCTTDAQGAQMASSTTQYCQNVVQDPCVYGCTPGVIGCTPGTLDAGWVSASSTSIVAQKNVRPSGMTTIYWYIPNVTSCTLTGSNGDTYTPTVVSNTAQGSYTTTGITSKTTYTMTCIKVGNTAWNSSNNSVTITITPQYQEI